MGCVIQRGTRDRPLWYVKYRDADGKWKMVPSHQPDRKSADKWVRQVEANIANGKAGIVEPKPEELSRARVTVKEAAERFLDEYSSPRVKSMENYRRDVKLWFKNHVYPDLGSRRACEVTRSDITRLRDTMLKADLAGASVRNVLAYLSRMFNWARTEGVIDCANPVAAVEKPSVGDREMLDYLTVSEVEALLAWSAEHQASEHALYATAVYTGMRLGELYGLRWIDVSLDRGQLTVARSYKLAPKSGKMRHIPINQRLAPILRQWQAKRRVSEEGLVFPSPRGFMRRKDNEYSDGFKAALAGAKCHTIRFHGLRHTFASHFIMSGGNILTLQRLLGHYSVTVTMKYAHLAPDFMREEMGRVSFDRPAAGVASLADRRSLEPARPPPAAEQAG